jgi:hypothetical protein
VSRVPVAERRAAREADRRRHVAGQYARATSAVDVAAVEFDRVRAAVKALRRRDPETAERAAAALVEQLARLAGRLESQSRKSRRVTN